MAFCRKIFAIALAVTGTAALTLNGEPLKELLVDHGNGTSFYWTQAKHADLELTTFDIVPPLRGLNITTTLSRAPSSEATPVLFERGGAVQRKFCDAFSTRYPSNLYDDSVHKFCREMGDLATYYFSSMYEIFENEVCRTEAGHSFSCGFLLNVIQQSAHGTIGPVAKQLCQESFNRIHSECGSKFGGVDMKIKESNGNSRDVEYRTNAIDKSAATCAKVQNPLPGRPHVCKVHAG